MARLTNDEIRDKMRAEKCPIVGTNWKHYKGGEYKVIKCVYNTVTEEIDVVYRPLSDAVYFSRPLSEWLEFLPDGTPRFQLVWR